MTSQLSLPLEYNPSSKLLNVIPGVEDKELRQDVIFQNQLTKELVGISQDVPPAVAPGPKAISPQLSMMVKKLRDAAAASFRAQKYSDAEKQFSLALEMATRRNKWEPFAFSLQELSSLLIARSEVFFIENKWLECFTDTDLLIQTQQVNAELFYRRGYSAMKLGKLDVAKADFERGLAFDVANENCKRSLEEVDLLIEEENS